jgi:hypothetical protein
MTRIAFAHAAAPALLLAITCLAFAGCADGSATTHLEIRFAGQAADVDADVGSDLSSRPTADAYSQAGIAHVDGYTAHDQLQDWKDSGGLDFSAQSFNGSFGAGFFLTSIGGVAADGSSAYWSLAINGKASDVGMSDAVLGDGDTVTWTYTAVGASAPADPDPIGVTVDPAAPTQAETTTITGSVNKDALVSIDGGPSADVKAGRWQLTTQVLDFGRTATVVRVDDGVHSVAVNVTLIRLAPATISAEFAAVPPRASIEDTVWFDVDAFLSAPQYEAAGIEHPPHANIHDAMVAWGREVEYSGPGTFGFGVESIEGQGYFGDWCYDVNGESAPLGITDMEFKPGDVIAWHGCFGV